jgi:MoxR-like ATPase
MMQPYQTRVSLTQSLGVQGWSHLDSILLAALATQFPLLLVGPHGTAKSQLIVEIARALGLSMRHYNASLLNYDDLVGIPMPEDDGDGLRFLSTPGSIWGAEFVFFDEISRCRPDLQNKMFPIIHERRIAGMQLEALQHRWSAMNPPAPEDPEINPGVDTYLGSEALDPALADRFPFVVMVPTWRQLSKADRRALVSGTISGGDSYDSDFDLMTYVEHCRAVIDDVRAALSEWITDYVVSAVDLLEQAGLAQSPRRAAMLSRALSAIHAARIVLEGDDAALERSAELTLRFCLPQTASEVPPSPATIIAVHRQSWEISNLAEGDAWRQVLEELNPARRVVLADQLALTDEDVSRLVTQALGAEPSDARRVGLATVLFLAFCGRRNLTPAAWEPLSQFAARVLEPRALSANLRPGAMTDIWHEIVQWQIPVEQVKTMRQRIERNFVFNGFPDLWLRFDWKQELQVFRDYCDMFGVGQETV